MQGDPSGGILCPHGHFCPHNTDSALQYPCPNGYFTAELGSVSQDECKLCPAGHYCASGIDFPRPCPLGESFSTASFPYIIIRTGDTSEMPFEGPAMLYY